MPANMMACSLKEVVRWLEFKPRHDLVLDDAAAASPTPVPTRDSGEAKHWAWLELYWAATVFNYSVCSLQ
jgi:hypothetical protein